MDIGFAGIGRMGHPLALHLAQAGHRVVAYDPYVTIDAELSDAGVEQAATVAALASTPVTFSILPDGATTAALLTGPEGLFALARPGHAHVAMATMGVHEMRALASAAADRGLRFADATLSGSVAAAKAKTLTAMIGAEDSLYRLILPLVGAFTGKQFHVGLPGSGTVVKLSVNVVVGAVNEAVGEAILLAERGGVDRELFYSVLSAGAGGGAYVEYKREAFLHPDSAGVDAPVSIIAKDMALALRLAADEGVVLPGTEANLAVAERAMKSGLGGADMVAAASVLGT